MMAAPRLLLFLLIVVLHLESLHTRYLLVQTDGEDGSASSKTNMRNKALSKDCDLCCAPNGGIQNCFFICCEDVKTEDKLPENIVDMTFHGFDNVHYSK